MNGWQNLAAVQHKTRDQDSVIDEIRETYPSAWETPAGDDYAYWVHTEKGPQLIGVCWKTNGSWRYVYMNEISFQHASPCALITAPVNRVVIDLAAITPAPAPAPIVAPVQVATPIVVNRKRDRVQSQVKRRVFQDGGKWWVKIETPTHLYHRGPFNERAEAVRAR